MSETMLIPPPGEPTQKRLPTVYFIDDSATMREVIKIAFRRENINVITCADAQSALSQFEQNRPDVVITDVIMPDKDGYSVCSEIKQHADYGTIPVVLMSGVVNKTVADKAVSVRADELIRKPFQPQELILRVKSLLQPKSAEFASLSNKPANPGLSLDKLFAPAPAQNPQTSAPRPSVVPASRINTRIRLATRVSRSLHASSRSTRRTSIRRKYVRHKSSGPRRATTRHLCRRKETPRRNHFPRHVSKKTPNRTAKRAPIQPIPRATDPHPNFRRLIQDFAAAAFCLPRVTREGGRLLHQPRLSKSGCRTHWSCGPGL